MIYDSVRKVETNPWLKDCMEERTDPARRFQTYGYFFPYMHAVPFADTLSNLHSQANLIQFFNEKASRSAKERVDPATLFPVVTADQLNDFFFMIDLNTMSAEDEQRAYDFLSHFHKTKSGRERMAIIFKDRSGVGHFGRVTDSVYAFSDTVDIPGNYPKWEKFNIPKTYEHPQTWPQLPVSYTMTSLQRKVIDDYGGARGRDNFVNESVFIHIGRHSQYKDYHYLEFDQLSNLCKYYGKYLHTIDLDAVNTYTQFDYIAEYAGGAMMRMNWGKELLTELILNRLVMYYSFDKRSDDASPECVRSPQTSEWISIFKDGIRQMPRSAPSREIPARTISTGN